MPRFLLQIVDDDEPQRHPVVRFQGGGKLERDLIADCTNAIVGKGVGMFKSEAAVRRAIADGITDVIRSLKHETVPLA